MSNPDVDEAAAKMAETKQRARLTYNSIVVGIKVVHDRLFQEEKVDDEMFLSILQGIVDGLTDDHVAKRIHKGDITYGFHFLNLARKAKAIMTHEIEQSYKVKDE